MVSSGALNDIGTAYGTQTQTVTAGKKAPAAGMGAEFGNVMRSSAQEKTAAAAANTDAVTFSAGAEIQKFGIMSQIKKPDLSADLFFSDDFEDTADDELDSAISFDEIEELDRISDTAAFSANADMLIFPEI